MHSRETLPRRRFRGCTGAGRAAGDIADGPGPRSPGREGLDSGRANVKPDRTAISVSPAKMRTRSKLELLLCWLLVAHTARAQDVRIGVFGLFHPRHLVLESPVSQALVIQAGDRTLVLERSSGQDTAVITSSGDVLILQVGNQTVRAYAIRVTSRSGAASDFMLAVPGKISRRYRGQLEVTVNSGSLVPVVSMELETAVASVVQAESDPDSPLEAMKAQAVATRSYLVAARGRHHDFDFCDTTHCQFLRESPPPDSNASRAAVATRGLVLGYRDQPVAAMFTRSCGGRTRTPGRCRHGSSGVSVFLPWFAITADVIPRVGRAT